MKKTVTPLRSLCAALAALVLLLALAVPAFATDGFAANIDGAMPEGWRIDVRCLLVSWSNP